MLMCNHCGYNKPYCPCTRVYDRACRSHGVNPYHGDVGDEMEWKLRAIDRTYEWMLTCLGNKKSILIVMCGNPILIPDELYRLIYEFL